MNREELSKSLIEVEKFATKSKFYRLLIKPCKYMAGMFYRYFYYPIFKKGVLKTAKTFWSVNVKVKLPSSMDIYLIGGKTHNSEIRLAKFYINYLKESDDSLDIGAHIGYFSLLSSVLAPKGITVAIEASPNTFRILHENIKSYSNIIGLNLALANELGNIEFLEFPILYSEFNTSDKEQYQNEKWFKGIKPRRISIKSETGENIIKNYNLKPRIIKIDVEGAEERVVSGLKDYLKNNNCFLVMEFASQYRGNTNHLLAERHLLEIEYHPHKINKDGILEILNHDTSVYVSSSNLESDNIVYCKM